MVKGVWLWAAAYNLIGAAILAIPLGEYGRLEDRFAAAGAGSSTESAEWDIGPDRRIDARSDFGGGDAIAGAAHFMKIACRVPRHFGNAQGVARAVAESGQRLCRQAANPVDAAQVST